MATRMREKTAKRHENADRRPHAVARYVRVAPRKVRAVVNLIRGKSVKEAEAILMLTPRGATEPVMKVLKSASANAQNNLDMNPDDLFVAEAYADQGPTLMRYRPRAHGRASRIRKRTSHITIVLDQQAK